MNANIRELKAKLSGVIRRVRAGETVTVSVRNRPVARIVPIARSGGLNELARTPGVAWKGGQAGGPAARRTSAARRSSFRLGGRGPALILYLDTSALVKLYVRERGSARVRAQVGKADAIATSVVAYAEARAAFARHAARAAGRTPSASS